MSPDPPSLFWSMIDMPYYLMLNMTKESNINQKIQKQFARVNSQANPKMTIVWDFCPGSPPIYPDQMSTWLNYGNFDRCRC